MKAVPKIEAASAAGNSSKLARNPIIDEGRHEETIGNITDALRWLSLADSGVASLWEPSAAAAHDREMLQMCCILALDYVGVEIANEKEA